MSTNIQLLVDAHEELEARVDLIESIRNLVSQHPAGDAIKIVLAPDNLNLDVDEVLVQDVASDGRSVTLRAVRTSELRKEDHLHDATNLALDDDYIEYLRQVRAASCLVRYDLKGNPQHIYE